MAPRAYDAFQGVPLLLPRYLHHVPGISQLVSSYQQRDAVDCARTGRPLSPASALRREQDQIASLELRVSLNDHDSIDAPMALQITASCGEVPVPVE